MAQAVHNTDKDYWRPANPALVRMLRHETVVCPSCAAESPTEARFCQACGRNLRQPAPASHKSKLPHLLNIETLGRHLGLSLSCLVFFILGITCLMGALAISLIYRPDTFAGWQALQVLRIEWLLGACATLLAGILLLVARR